MKFTTIILLAFVCFGQLAQVVPVSGINGAKDLSDISILVYSQSEGGRLIWAGTSGDRLPKLRIADGFISNIEDIIPERLISGEDLWIEFAGLPGVDGRIRYTAPLRRERPDDPGETTETMATHLQIGMPGETDDLVVNSPRTGFGIDTPTERIDVDGAIGFKEGAAPSATSEFGKVYVNDSDGHLYFIDEAGNVTDLTVDANAVQSVSSSANPTGRTEHMRFIPGESAEITESATDDTIYIHYSLGGTSPCSAPPDPPASIEGPASVCEMAMGIGYAVPPVAGATYYYWGLPAESYIASGAGSNSVVVNFGSTDGNISVSSYNDCGTSATSTSLAITMNRAPLMPGSITGSVSVCASATESYSISPVSGATSYSWTLPSGAFIASGYGTNSITVTFASTSGTICVTADNACGSSDPQCVPVTVFSSLAGVMPGAISGPGSVCAGETGVTYSISEMPSATSYSWSIPSGATVISGIGTNSLTVDFGSTSGNVSVTASNLCGTSDARVLAVSVSPNSVGGSISGTSAICLGASTGTMTLSGNVGSVTKWQKSRDGGGWVDISRTDITYSETPSLSGAWEYRAQVKSGACDAVYSASHTVNVSPVSVGGDISGYTSPICFGGSTGTMTLSGYTGSVLRWQRTTNGGSTWTDITNPSPTYSETPAAEGTYQYRAAVQSGVCSESFSTTTTPIVVNPIPTADFTVSNINPAVTRNVDFSAAEGGATYSWTFPGGTPATSTSQSPTVTWSSTGTYTVGLTVTKGGCSSSMDTTITVRSLITQTFNATGSGRTGTIQNWTVPGTGIYQIEVWGAQGGSGTSYTGGLGARMRGDFVLTTGTALKILVGHQGGSNSSYNGSGGGGGSFVTLADNTPLIIAGGGGGGGGNSSAANGQPGRTETSGGNGSTGTATGGTSGNGGNVASGSGAGGGLLTGGATSPLCAGVTSGASFVSGGTGGTRGSCTASNAGGDGGFGGGGGGEWCCMGATGGGGGYSGGAGTGSSGVAGGGGSYNDGTNQSNTAGVRSGHGLVTITY